MQPSCLRLQSIPPTGAGALLYLHASLAVLEHLETGPAPQQVEHLKVKLTCIQQVEHLKVRAHMHTAGQAPNVRAHIHTCTAMQLLVALTVIAVAFTTVGLTHG